MSVARVALLSLALAGPAFGQSLPHIRDLGAPVATTVQSFRGMPTIRALSDGRVLVSDATARQLVAYDSMLGKAQPILTANGPAASQFPSRGGALLPLPGDTT